MDNKVEKALKGLREHVERYHVCLGGYCVFCEAQEDFATVESELERLKKEAEHNQLWKVLEEARQGFDMIYESNAVSTMKHIAVNERDSIDAVFKSEPRT